jgi:F0F1-type ATP synthase membrane subunit a
MIKKTSTNNRIKFFLKNIIDNLEKYFLKKQKKKQIKLFSSQPTDKKIWLSLAINYVITYHTYVIQKKKTPRCFQCLAVKKCGAC